MKHTRKMRQLLFICVLAMPVAAPLVSAEDARSDKLSMQLMYHDLDMKNQKAKQDYKVSLNISEMEGAYNACIGKEAALKQCQEVTVLYSDKLRSIIHDAEMLAESKKQTELLKRQEEAVKQNNTSITIQEDDSRRWHDRDHDWHGHDDLHDWRPTQVPVTTPGYTPRPGFVPKNRFQAGDGFR